MVIPYIDTNPLGSGYYTWKQRKFSIGTFLFGFVVLWVAMIIIGTFIRGPGWQWFWPGQTWDHNRLIYEVNRDLPDLFGIASNLGKAVFGASVFAVPAAHEKRFSAHELVAVCSYAIFVADHGGPAPEDGAAALVAHQVRVDHALVQYMKIAEVRLQIADFAA